MLDQEARNWLRRLLGPHVRFDEPMARHTSFKVGGPADALVEPESEEQLKELLQWRRKTKTPCLIVGGGTNLLVRDGGVRGLVIHLGRMAGGISWDARNEEIRVSAGSAAPTRRLCRLSLAHGWQGMNFALGIAGTVGGALLMNAGTAHGAMADVLEAVTVMTGRAEKVKIARESLNAQYRRLLLPEALMAAAGPIILLEGHFVLMPGNRQDLRREAQQIMQQRARRQPAGRFSAGCFFRNPGPERPAGRLIDEAGLKGFRIGDAQVSSRHANFIVNLGRATAAEILEVAATVAQRVEKHAGVRLTPEVHVVGE